MENKEKMSHSELEEEIGKAYKAIDPEKKVGELTVKELSIMFASYHNITLQAIIKYIHAYIPIILKEITIKTEIRKI